MLSKSAITRLQTILIIDLIIVGSAAGGFFYLNSLPKPLIDSANVRISDLSINPSEAYIGTPILISFNVSNRADEVGICQVDLLIDDLIVRSTSVELQPDEARAQEFTIEDLDEGTHIVTVGNVEGTVTILSVFRVSDLSVNRTIAAVGEPIGIFAKVTNQGDQIASYPAILKINGTTRETKNVELEPNATVDVKFEIVENTVGTYIFQIGGLNGTYTITAAAPPAKPAEFEVTNLIIDPAVAEQGAEVLISVKVTNVGETSGDYTLTLNINGTEMETQTVTLAGGSTTTVEFSLTEETKGNYIIEIGGLTDTLRVQGPSTISIDSFIVRPYENWANDTVTVNIKTTNKGGLESSLSLKLVLDGEIVETKTIGMEAGASQDVVFNIPAPPLEGDQMSKLHTIEVNGFKGGFNVVKTGYHTLSVETSPFGDAEFKLNGELHATFYSALLPEGKYTVDIATTDPTGRITFERWDGGSTSHIRTVYLDKETRLTAYYTGGTSCPSLFIWNGTDNVYVCDVSNHGWLGYIKNINSDGSITFYRNNPWDFIKLDKTQLKETDSTYNLTLIQRWNEIFYLDQAYMLVVDHPADVDVYSTMVEEYLNPEYMGIIYTVNKNLLKPVSAYNENGENVLDKISAVDGVFTSGGNGILSPAWDDISWNKLTLDLGDLSDANQIKLVLRAIVDWGSGEDYVTYLDKFFAQPVPDGTEITPPPFMEVKDASGNWIKVPWERQIPLPPDGNPRTFVVDLTGLFPTDDYSLRINNFWNVTFDYIGIDVSEQKNLNVQRIDPVADLYQAWETPSSSSGNFTRYGDVTELVTEADDEFVIGRQGDAVSLQFSTANLDPVSEGMERDIFFFVSCWFKDENGNWGFGFGFTSDPLPFSTMSGFPYPETESYPYEEHWDYLNQYNTRIILPKE